MPSLEQKRVGFLLKFMNQVSFEGFSLSAARISSLQVANDINYYTTLFPGGLSDIAFYYEEYCLSQMINKLLVQEEELKRTTKKIETALICKIINNDFSKESIRNLYKYYLHPANAHITLKSSWKVCDTIWHWAGDKSTDYNHYTKRALLFSVYNAATLYYLNDDSEQYIKTKKFISSSLKKVSSIGSVKNTFKSILSKADNIPILRMFL